MTAGSRSALTRAVICVALGATLVGAVVVVRQSGDAGSPPRSACPRPYDAESPWNRPIGPQPRVHADSARYLAAIADNGKPLTSDPDQYTPAVYAFDERTPLRTVRLSGYYSTYDAGDDSRKGYGFAPTISRIPIPANAAAPPGDDGQVVLWNPKTGVEYGFWQFGRGGAGSYTATNGYRYHTVAQYRGRFADGKAGRGAGLPYLGGLVRRCEIDRGRIDHALAFAYSAPARRTFVYPASKTDGLGSADDVPEGSRLQLDPSLDEDDFEEWRLTPHAQTIARALQRFGMYVVDNSGSSKIFLEARQTARWDSSVGADLLSAIPWTAFRVIQPPSRR